MVEKFIVKVVTVKKVTSDYLPTIFEMSILRVIQENPGKTVTQLHQILRHEKGNLGMSEQSVARSVCRANDKGMIYRKQIPDKRPQCKGRMLYTSYLSDIGKVIVSRGNTRLNNAQLERRQKEKAEKVPVNHAPMNVFLYSGNNLTR